MRTIARETVFKILFSSQFSDGVDIIFKRAMYKTDKLDEKDIAYCDKVLEIINEHSNEFTTLLDTHSHSFPENRIYPADKSILLIALAEILYMDDVPDKVALNEAANIASKYSSAKSASFITGILSAIMEEKGNV
jgi:N utilization substance protein B